MRLTEFLLLPLVQQPSLHRDLVSVVIPDTVISIETEAFSGCEDLTHVILPDSLTSIAEKAFAGCSKLTSIAYNGTPEEWGTLVAQNADAELRA